MAFSNGTAVAFWFFNQTGRERFCAQRAKSGMLKFAPLYSDKLTDRSTLDFTIAMLEHCFDLSAAGPPRFASHPLRLPRNTFPRCARSP
ncbi:hypothetical protein TFLX_05430 [Thermoflexales bacterium]|nr:hypothetical protein TFLX_05430 [Thermoflexales bacterium]